VNRQPSDAYDVDQIAESAIVVGITGVERKTVGVSGRGDEEVGDAPPVRPARLDRPVSTTAATICP
jgi:hypothetical protein